VALPRDPQARVVSTQEVSGVLVERVVLTVEPGIQVPLALLSASGRREEPPPEPSRSVVILHSRRGKAALVKARAREIAGLLEGGAAVCLPDLRGTGETSPGEDLGRRSINTTLACRDAVLGQTLLAGRLRDLRSVIAHLRTRPDCGGPLAMWGASLAPINPADRPAAVPFLVDNPNTCSEPTPGLLSLLVALFDEEVEAVAGDGTFASFFSVLESPFVYAPHDAVVPGVLAESDVPDLIGALAPRPVRLEQFVNGLNRRVASSDVARALDVAVRRYRAQGAATHLCLPAADPRSTGKELTAEQWLLGALER
jgi:pimeloyl-ACP methyl ester carboxylesterase